MNAPGEAIRESSSVMIRGMERSDVPAVSSIVRESPAAANWSEENILRATESASAWVAEQNGRVIGFLIGRGVADEFEILNLAVAELSRRRGIATRLLETMAAWMQRAGMRRSYLEVRASNEPAIALYKRHGFSPCGRRARYYQHPIEDAIVLSRDDGPER
jgi:[ribosomal protein S18]-alanine N-acetyltransferase